MEHKSFSNINNIGYLHFNAQAPLSLLILIIFYIKTLVSVLNGHQVKKSVQVS